MEAIVQRSERRAKRTLLGQTSPKLGQKKPALGKRGHLPIERQSSAIENDGLRMYRCWPPEEKHPPCDFQMQCSRRKKKTGE